MELAVQQRVLTSVQEALSTAEFQAYQLEIDALIEDCRTLKVTDAQTLAIAVDLISKINDVIKRVEDAGKNVNAEPQGFITGVKDQIKRWLDPLRDLIDRRQGVLTVKVLDYRRIEEQRRREEEAKAREEAAKLQARLAKRAEKAGTPPVEVPSLRVPKSSNVSTGTTGKVSSRKVWKAELTDIIDLARAVIDRQAPSNLLTFDPLFLTDSLKAVLVKAVLDKEAPQDLLSFNLKVANGLATQTKGTKEIAGVRFYQDEGLAIY